jgi:hypothetical protein
MISLIDLFFAISSFHEDLNTSNLALRVDISSDCYVLFRLSPL